MPESIDQQALQATIGRLEHLLDCVDMRLAETAQVPLVAATRPQWSKPFLSEECIEPRDLFAPPKFTVSPSE